LAAFFSKKWSVLNHLFGRLFFKKMVGSEPLFWPDISRHFLAIWTKNPAILTDFQAEKRSVDSQT
jgi:hypothetical protein